MQGFLQNKIVLVGAIGIAVALAAWYGLTSPAPQSNLITTTEATAGPGQELVETLLALRAVKLDGAIFSQSSFAGLIDYSTPIVPEPVGRPNPFAPLSLQATTTGSKDAALFAPQAAATNAAVKARGAVRP